MPPTKKTLLLIGLVVLLLAAIAATAYMMWHCVRGDAAPAGTEKFESGGGGGGGAVTKAEYFAMEGCPHCRDFDPVWKATESAVMGNESASTLSLHRWDIRTEDGKAAAKAAGVTAFPHVQKTLPDGSVEVFNGKRTEEELTKFITN